MIAGYLVEKTESEKKDDTKRWKTRLRVRAFRERQKISAAASETASLPPAPDDVKVEEVEEAIDLPFFARNPIEEVITTSVIETIMLPPPPPPRVDPLHLDGFGFVGGVPIFPPTVLERFKDIDFSKRGYAIFNTRPVPPTWSMALHESKHMPADNKRRCANLALTRAHVAGAFLCEIKSWLSTVFPRHIAHKFVLIESQADCPEQLPHTDWVRDRWRKGDWSDADTVPLEVIISLEDGGTLEVWPGSHVPGQPAKKIQV